MTSALCKILKIAKAPAAWNNVPIRKKYNPVRTAEKSKSSTSPKSSSQFGGPQLCIRFLHNLMNALPAQVKRICNLTKRHSLAAHANNLRISIIVRGRPWLQRAPGPFTQIFKFLDSFRGKEPFLATLSGVAHPSPDMYVRPINNLNMDSRDSGVSLAAGELFQGSDIKFKTCSVIHGVDFITKKYSERE